MSAEALRDRPRAGLKTFDARDVETARQGLGAIYSAPASAEWLDKRRPFLLRMRGAALGRLTLGSFDIANASLTRESGESVILALPLGGAFEYRKGRDRRALVAQKHIAVTHPFESYGLDCPQGRGLALTLPVADLAAHAERMTDKTQSTALLSRMNDQVDATGPLAGTLARRMKAAMAEFAELDAVGLGALAAAGYADLLLNLAIPTLFPAVAEAMAAAPADCGPAVVRRARDYIREHADEPIELARLAADLGVSMRAIQENFQRRYRTSPRDYIQECRLERAHRRLNAPEPGSSVTSIALDSGFSDLGAFSAKYRDRYDELPSETLRSARTRIGGPLPARRRAATQDGGPQPESCFGAKPTAAPASAKTRGVRPP